MSYSSDDGMMRMPNPIDPQSGWTNRSDSPGYASGFAPGPAPDGKVFIPGMNTYVDLDIAEQLGLTGPQGTSSAPTPAAFDPRGIPAGDDPNEYAPEAEEISDEELAELQKALEVKHDDGENENYQSLSDTLDTIAEHVSHEVLHDGIDTIVATGDLTDAISLLTEATGLDAGMASQLMETAVMEASPIADEHIGSDRWTALLYASSRTDDPFARRVVSDVVSGRLHPSRLAGAYDLWFQSLPDADG